MSAHSEEQIGEIPLELKADLDNEVVAEFIADAREQLENIEHGTLALEKNPHDQEVIHTLFRAFHTFKGNAGLIDLLAISQLAHALESLLNEARNNELQINSVIIDLILKSRDTLKHYVDEIEAQITGKKPRASINLPTAALKAIAKHLLHSKGGAGSGKPLEIKTPKPPKPSSIAATGGETADSDQAVPLDGHQVGEATLHAVKVPTSKLDGLVDLAGELLIAQSLIVQSVSSVDTNRHALVRNLDQLNRISKELQRTAMSMRMVPVRATFQKMHRLVRDIAADQGKSVRLVLEGEETEIDRTIVEKLADPLMHMVRNAVDHAIELPERRVASGKPADGTITLRAYHKSGSVIVEVEDDGVGLHREQIREKAIRNGLLTAEAKPEDRDLLNLILRPGFSTATTVTAISGRGVGMDVVHKNIAELRGRIDIKSVAGQGTTFTLRLPLTLAIIDGLILRVGSERYILPTLSVRESFHPKTCPVTSLPGGAELAEIRKELVPLLRLRDHFQLKETSEETGTGILIVIESDGKKRCLLADELIGKQEVVIKNLGEVFKTDPMVSGGAILGDGCVGLILDPGALVHLEPASTGLQLAI